VLVPRLHSEHAGITSLSGRYELSNSDFGGICSRVVERRRPPQKKQSGYFSIKAWVADCLRFASPTSQIALTDAPRLHLSVSVDQTFDKSSICTNRLWTAFSSKPGEMGHHFTPAVRPDNPRGSLESGFF
jgi:hypothetical protein